MHGIALVTKHIFPGDSLVVNSTLGQVVNVDFKSPITITDAEDYAESQIPSDYQLMQNFPNPFNPSTNFEFRIAESGFVSLKVYDLLGREVAVLVNEEKQAGTYQIEFSAQGGSASGGDASALASGIYFYKLQVGNFIETKKMILLR